MDFASISNINSYMKTLKMSNIWKRNVDSPFKSVASVSSSKASEEPSRSTGAFGDDRLMSIKTKMKSGQKLSSSDLDYLRENYPDEYANVMKLEREKKAYEKELGRCKTKEDARMLHMGKVTEALTALKSGGDPDMILAKLSKMSEAYGKFTESAHYSKLAENHMELAKAIKAEKEAITGKKEIKQKNEESRESEVQIAGEAYETQTIDDENGDIEAQPVLEPQQLQPMPETLEGKPVPKPDIPQTAYTYTPKSYATQTVSHDYTHERGSPRSGMDMDV